MYVYIYICIYVYIYIYINILMRPAPAPYCHSALGPLAGWSDPRREEQLNKLHECSSPGIAMFCQGGHGLKAPLGQLGI